MNVPAKRFAASAALLSTVLFCFGMAKAGTPPDSFTVNGDVKKTESWTVSRLQTELAAQVKTIDYTLKGEKHSAHAVPLRAVIDVEEPRINPRIKHHELQFQVEVIGHDNYAVDFSLAEMLPDFGNHPVWVALDKDGKPLPSSEGPPLDLIVPDDVKPARWVHGIVSVVVTDSAAHGK